MAFNAMFTATVARYSWFRCEVTVGKDRYTEVASGYEAILFLSRVNC
ncbi:Uncharacterised protein [Serratia entomophila]|nr:Uncharacterised protein [Serratia entomophila]CAI0807490.1 Uncharacterised protein [Serratia entomophila]CAI1527053.1 Uncharacterised protein [Serratia entomophila]CAI1620352.1 Uncharacterised protein [Serratia entomophila]CAI1620417.1 Uncharacterised protein [Serratia entomophila]